MNFILFDHNRLPLLPFTFTRPVSEIRFGILTIREKWEKHLKAKTSYLTENYLQKKYPAVIKKENIFINGSVCPDEKLIKEIAGLKKNQKLDCGDMLIAAGISGEAVQKILSASDSYSALVETTKSAMGVYTRSENLLKITCPWDIFALNGKALMKDYKLLTKGRISQRLSSTNHIIGKDLFVEGGVKAECSVFNSTSGPVYLGKNSEVMEGSCIRGSFALCEESVLKLGAKIYGPTTIGPYSKVGGEVNNCVIFGYTNKAHDGFIGNSVIGEWCNLGAGTNTSNLKNTYGVVEVWSYTENRFADTGHQFCGLLMGDHSKCGINTMFNTGTVAGTCCNIFGSGFPRKFIPDFSWGGAHGFQTYQLNKVFEVEKEVFNRRKLRFSNTDKDILTHVFGLTKEYRKNYR